MSNKTVFNTASDNKIKIYNPRFNIGHDTDNDMTFIILSNYNIKIFFNNDNFDELIERLKTFKP